MIKLMIKIIKILLLEDNPGDASLIEEMVNDSVNYSYELVIAETMEDGMSLLKLGSYDIILLDLGLPDSDGINTFLNVQKVSFETPIIILTGLNVENIAVKAVKMGAQDYLTKGKVDPEILERSIKYSIERKKVQIELQNYRDNLEEQVEKRTEELDKANKRLKIEIDDHKQTELKMSNYLAELKRSNKELQQFAYVASHDLQEPLRMVASFTQLLANKYKGQLDSDADEFIKFAVDGAQRMQQLINDLLAYSRVSSRVEEFQLVDFEKVFNESLQNLKVSIDDNDARITNDSLPTIVADQSQIIQLFQNLVGNAIKFRGEETPVIHVAAEEEEDEWIFRVIDNGIGIDSQHNERIFRVFQRLHERDSYPGTGIGLSICEKIVERHGGNIWVDSKLGDGSTFSFTISKQI
jgi:signal transduction histidine kinase